MAFNVGNLLGGVFNSETLFFIDNPYILSLGQTDFIKYEVEALYKKLLFDCLSRSDGLPTVKQKKVGENNKDVDLSPYYDSVIIGDAGSKGLISFLAEAMQKKSKISLVYKDGVIVQPDKKEQTDIDNGKMKNGLSCDFSNYYKTDILNIYFSLLYTVIYSLNTQVNISKSIQVKIAKLRDLIGVKDKASLKSQGQEISKALKNGNSVLLDALDSIEAMQLNTKPASEAMELIISRISAVIGMPVSYINGQTASGLSSNGQGDEYIVDRGLQNIFNEVFKRVSDKLLNTNLVFKKNNLSLITERLKLLPIVESSVLFSEEEKTEFAQNAIKP